MTQPICVCVCVRTCSSKSSAAADKRKAKDARNILVGGISLRYACMCICIRIPSGSIHSSFRIIYVYYDYNIAFEIYTYYHCTNLQTILSLSHIYHKRKGDMNYWLARIIAFPILYIYCIILMRSSRRLSRLFIVFFRLSKSCRREDELSAVISLAHT